VPLIPPPLPPLVALPSPIPADTDDEVDEPDDGFWGWFADFGPNMFAGVMALDLTHAAPAFAYGNIDIAENEEWEGNKLPVAVRGSRKHSTAIPEGSHVDHLSCKSHIDLGRIAFAKVMIFMIFIGAMNQRGRMLVDGLCECEWHDINTAMHIIELDEAIYYQLFNSLFKFNNTMHALHAKMYIAAMIYTTVYSHAKMYIAAVMNRRSKQGPRLEDRIDTFTYTHKIDAIIIELHDITFNLWFRMLFVHRDNFDVIELPETIFSLFFNMIFFQDSNRDNFDERNAQEAEGANSMAQLIGNSVSIFLSRFLYTLISTLTRTLSLN